MTNSIERHKPKKTTNSVEPLHTQNPYAVQDSAVPGSRYLQEALKLVNQKGFSKTIENATVLEVISPINSPDGKTKYILPHLNMKDGATFEGYLCKIRLPEDVGCIPDPQDIHENKSQLSAKEAFEGQSVNSIQKKIELINYFELVSNHKTFAPINPKNTKRPMPNSKVRVHCFSEPHMYCGSSIDGFYEPLDVDDSIFEDGSLNRFLSGARTFLSENKTIIQTFSSNISQITQQLTKTNTGVSSDDLESEDERGQETSGVNNLRGEEMLSEHFSLSQLTVNRRHTDIDNTPSFQQKENLRLLANNVLEPIRSRFGDLIITSGYRSPDINQRVGGSKTGDHPRGMAADIVPVTGTKNLLEIANWIRDNLVFKQLIMEMWRPEANRGWIHISYDQSNNKKQSFEMYKDENGQTKSRPLKKV